ncbi:hypothetical protein EW145_g116 [Phellinidium pouzarii]|uniref:Non-canonical E2 ubiquitin-conjugating enzyme C-terminal domain-containing protein n=1 Tax=Phellinidium pouzarii TaxID=167371 RepID=A0A4S4LLG8_9AGAM|nr:hypothetical protein EW145_g116 [Phellinidium pouzarii]
MTEKEPAMQQPGLSLAGILDSDNHESVYFPEDSFKTGADVDAEGWDEEDGFPAKEGFCIECGGASWILWTQFIYDGGVNIQRDHPDQPAQVHCEDCADDYCEVCFAAQHRKGTRQQHTQKPLDLKQGERKEMTTSQTKNVDEMEEDEDSGKEDLDEPVLAPSAPWMSDQQPKVGEGVGDWFINRAKFIPLRLTLPERKYLRLLEAALQVSEYTDKIDTIVYGSKLKRIVQQIRELCAILSGLVLAADYKQDSQIPEVKSMMNFSCIKPVETVYNVLERHDALDLLRDDLITVATSEIYSDGRLRREIQKDIKRKEQAIETLSSKYSRNDLTQEALRQCLYSISDNHAFLRANRDPCEKMIGYLKEHFHPTHPKDNKSLLAIRSGKSADQDLLCPDISYHLRDTGQGLNRVQAAPKTSRMMHAILHRAQTNIGSWVGSSVIHMGDHNVPNALMFIDKYSQIYRILLPICNVLAQIPNLMEKPSLRSYIEDEFGSQDNLYKEILGDFFRHAFDGSGADNFFDAGSCIDGRLTSAWNWTSLLERKRYFPVFLLAGFIGFDGDW